MVNVIAYKRFDFKFKHNCSSYTVIEGDHALERKILPIYCNYHENGIYLESFLFS